jgi:peptidoglycan-associated lipoprotein
MEGSLNERPAIKRQAEIPPVREYGGTAMFDTRLFLRGVRLAAVLAAALAISACAKNAEEGAQANAAGMATPGSQQDFVVNVGDRVFFETDSTELTPQSRATLDKQAQWLTQYSNYGQFTVEGHADERGTREYNIALGARRAQTVRDYLASRGIQTSRMRTISYGKERPVAVCNDISCWSQNRRAVTVLNVSS